ncbi:MAG TPA: hypothetical protein VGD94_15955 [Vicinamibacterales bacterium]
MKDPAAHVDLVVDLVVALQDLGLPPVLVGGMALVVLGSRRVTRDFDFVVPAPGERLAELITLLYDRGLELVSRLDDAGEVVATLSNRRVAASRLAIDRPAAAYFYDAKTGLRIDLLFDFPLAAATLAERATRIRVGSGTLHLADERDLLDLKRRALAGRQVPGDADDVAFLERLLEGR